MDNKVAYIKYAKPFYDKLTLDEWKKAGPEDYCVIEIYNPATNNIEHLLISRKKNVPTVRYLDPELGPELACQGLINMDEGRHFLPSTPETYDPTMDDHHSDDLSLNEIIELAKNLYNRYGPFESFYVFESEAHLEDNEEHYAFVYFIYNLTKDKYYIGCKTFTKGWSRYTGSSAKLNQDIDDGDEIVKIALKLIPQSTTQKWDTKYWENWFIYNYHALVDSRSYNGYASRLGNPPNKYK